MAVQPRRKIPEAIYLVVLGKGSSAQRTWLYHSYQHAWNLKEHLGGQLFKIGTAGMVEINA